MESGAQGTTTNSTGSPTSSPIPGVPSGAAARGAGLVVPGESDKRDQIDRFGHLLRRFRALLLLCGTCNLVGAAWAGSRELIAFALVMLAVSASTAISQRLLRAGRITAAAAVAAYGELGLAFVAGMLFPEGAEAVVIAGMIAVGIALPYLEGRQLRWFLVASYAILVAVLGRGFRHDVRLALPFWLEFWAVVIGGAAGTYVLLLLLWQFTDRLRLTLERTRHAHRVAESARRSADFLAEASRRLGAASLDQEGTLRLIAHLLVPELADYCFVDALTEPGERRPVEAVHADPDRQYLVNRFQELYRSARRDSVGSVAAMDRAKLVRDVDDGWLQRTAQDGEQLSVLRTLAPRSVIIVPLVARGRPLGSVLIARTAERPAYDERDLVLVEQLAGRGALAADNARLYAEAQSAVRARDEFLSIASHELKTPLTPLQLAVQAAHRRLPEIVEGTLAPGWLEHRFSTIERQIHRLGRLVDELLDLSRLLAGKFRLELELVDLGEMVRDLSERFQGLESTAPELRLTLQCEEGVRGRWDRLRLEQVVTNLLSNAMKYGSGLPIEVSVSSRGQAASLAVTDHGVGISADDQRRIFERFERASTTAHLAGLGLGLFITRQIVDALGGTIRVASELGKGSTFTVELPLAGPPEEPVRAAPN